MKRTFRTELEQQVIDEAKTMLMYVNSMSEPVAYAYMRNYCMDNRLKMHETALVLLKRLTQELVRRNAETKS